MDARILLPVRPHILKYLKFNFGEAIPVSGKWYIPTLIYRMLEKFEKTDPAVVRPSQKLIDNKEYFGFRVYVGPAIRKNKGAYISRENILRFNDLVDEMIKEEMYRFVTFGTSRIDDVVDYNIIRWRDIYGITEDELSFDNLKRWYYRNRQRIEKRRTYQEPPQVQFTLTF